MYVLGRILRKQQHSLEERHMSGTTDFDFWLHTWDVVNKRKKVRSLYDDPESNQQAEWEEFSGVAGMGTKYCDGRQKTQGSRFPPGSDSLSS